MKDNPSWQSRPPEMWDLNSYDFIYMRKYANEPRKYFGTNLFQDWSYE